MTERPHCVTNSPTSKVVRLLTGKPRIEQELVAHRLVYVDPRPVSRETMDGWLSKRLHDYEVISVADSAAALSELKVYPDTALLLYNSGGQSNDRSRLTTILTSLTGNAQRVPVAVLADTDETATVVAALECGVRGYIPTASSAAVMIGAMRLICAGDIYAPAAAVMRQVTQDSCPTTGGRTMSGKDSLSPRQLQIVECLRRGIVNKQIALELGMSPGTVKVHLRSIMKKLSVVNRTQIVLATIPLG